MGALMLWIGLSFPALGAPELQAVVTQSPLVLGAPFWVEVATLDGRDAVSEEPPGLTVTGGEGEEPILTKPGRWEIRVIPEPNSPRIDMAFEWRGARQERSVFAEKFPATTLEARPFVNGRTGRPVSFVVADKAGSPLTEMDLRVVAGEGEASVDCSSSASCEVTWTPGPTPYPRAVPIFTHDERHPTRQPMVTVARLFAEPSIPVQTEPGAKVTLEIGSQSYGPLIANSNGMVRFDVSVGPADREAIATLEDKLGNRQKSTIMIGGKAGPSLAITHQGSIIEGGLPPLVTIVATHASGSLQHRMVPVCDGLSSEGLVQTMPGAWAGYIDSGANSGQRVTCSLPDGTSVTKRVPVERSRATRLVVQSYPTQLSADIPIAEIQAYLLNGLGERLDPSGVHLTAELGRIQRDQMGTELLVRARYDGGAAAKAGQDVVRASWRRPSGSGGVWDLAIRGASPLGSGEILVDARAVDQGGRPIEGIPIQIDVEDSSKTANTRGGGWATETFPWPGRKSWSVVEVRVGEQIRRTIVLPGDRAEAAAGSPDLLTDLLIPIQAGRVHGVILTPQPRELANDGMVGQIEVRLEDKLGNIIVAPGVEISASKGDVGPVQLRANGVSVATYTPPLGMSPGPVRLTATTDDGRFSASTDVAVIHRAQNWGAGFRGGLLAGSNALATFHSSLFVEGKTPFEGIYAKGSVSNYFLSTAGTDPITGDPVELGMQVVPIGLGGVFRKGLRRYPYWVGAQFILAPYDLNVQVGTNSQGAWGWLGPGASLNSGVGVRILGGELFAEVEYLFMAAPSQTYGWVGSIGGVVVGAGYKLLY